ncbi:UNVERIFIED_CONTAM: SAGA-associated factor 29A [Sesamum radiatum]|uniref:SAGA-associated factor 29A n=1 Tax=Sesamum radiatum TaxID=300843 RepID=A0AAW2V5B2_SESRA
MKADSDVSRLSPSMRSHLESLANLKGEQVAARVTQEDAGKDEWFVVKVIHFDKETREFEVLDEEPGDDEEGSGQRLALSSRSICQIYLKIQAAYVTYLFPSGPISLVSPIFLQGNMFWQCIQKPLHYIKQLSSKLASYILEFDDDEEDGSLPQRSVPFHRVVPLPEGYRQ